MSIEIRQALPDEMEHFQNQLHTELILSSQEMQMLQLDNKMTFCAYEDGQLATTYLCWPMKMSFHGSSMPVACITMVSTSSVYRRRGYLRKTIKAHFEKLYEEKDCSIAVLRATRAAIYQRYGFGIVMTRNSYNVEPAYLQFFNLVAVKGSLQTINATRSLKKLMYIYMQFREKRTGYLQRSRATWDATILNPPKDGVLSSVIYTEEGKALSYLIYTLEKEPENFDQTGPWYRLRIRDCSWLTPAAYRAIWEYLKNMDLVRNIIWQTVPPDDPLPNLILEPRMLHTISQDGLLGRIIDIKKALPGRSYSDEGELTFEVIDELCPWNRQTWKLKTSKEGSEVCRTGKSPMLRIPESTLAMLIFNQINATQAARMGRLDVMDHSSLQLWDRLLETGYRPFCPDIF